MTFEPGQRRQGRFTKLEREVLSAARDMLAPQGFELEWGYGSKHPGIFAVKDGKTFFLPSSNTPKRPTDQVRHMQRKCHLLLQGQWRPH